VRRAGVEPAYPFGRTFTESLDRHFHADAFSLYSIVNVQAHNGL